MISITSLNLLVQSLNLAFSNQVFYELKDLEVLEKERNFEEFLSHVNDIRPSERSKHWKEMFQSMAIGLIDYKIKSKDFSEASFKQIEQIGKSSAMMNDEFFQLKRAMFAKKYFTECFKKLTNFAELSDKSSQKLSCENSISNFWLFSKKDPDIGLDLAQIIEKNNAKINTWVFYQRALQDNIAQLYCQKPFIQKAILKKLNEESFQKEFNGNYRDLLDKYVPNTCFNQLVEPLRATVISQNANSIERELAINLLEAKNKISSEDSDLYAVIYLLNGPIVGDKFNLAWIKIEKLNDSFSKRQILLKRIRELETLPDQIFNDPEMPRHKAIINLFAKNFPEYLSFYGDECINSLSNRNPVTGIVPSSLNCSQFLKAANAQKKAINSATNPWVSDSVETQFSALKR